MAEAAAPLITGATGDWEVVVGMEIHAQVASKAKLFSGAATAFGAEPNTQVSFVDAGMPGMLPVINRYCVEQAVRTGLGLNAVINKWSIFDRKNYFYPDLPQGYQISQYKQPIVGEGNVRVDLKNGDFRNVGIERLHLEQDAGKSLHDQHPTLTYVDLNRSGVALMEIVSKPDMRSGEEAGAYFRKVQTLVRYLGTCDGNMAEGSLRTDVNVSVRRPGGELGTRTETKNVNSIRFVQMVVEYEAQRQVDLLEDGGEVEQETRLFDPNSGHTRSMRNKEEAHDYRYFPCPDLLPLQVTDEEIERIRADLPELPDEKKQRFLSELGLSDYDASVLVQDRIISDYFEQVAENRNAKTVANWITGELFSHLNRLDMALEDCPVTTEQFGALIDCIADDTVSGRGAKDVLAEMVETGDAPMVIIERRGLKQVSDSGAIEAMVRDIVQANPDKVAEIRGGKDKLKGWFVGQAMKASGGTANPKMVNQILAKLLTEAD